MNRRRFLEFVTLSSGFIAGCSGQSERGNNSSTTGNEQTISPLSTSKPTHSRKLTETESPTPTETPRANPDTIFVDPSGSTHNEGTSEAPLDSIQAGVDRAEPGVTVRVAPGEYREKIITSQSGNPDAPITISGPPDAILRGASDRYGIIRINHSHIHIRGLTIVGLLEPEKPEQLSAYMRGQLIQTRPPKESDEYLENIVIAPDKIGYSRKSLVGLERTKQAEIGPFRVIGHAGAKYTVTSADGGNGEIVYIGTSPSNLGTNWHPWTDLDETRDIHVHHIDNSAGYAHSEIVNAKPGTARVIVEYCSDLGGAFIRPDWEKLGAINVAGNDCRIRRNDIQNNQTGGVTVHIGRSVDPWNELIGQDNRIYGNRILQNSHKAITVNMTNTEGEYQGDFGPDLVCGNEYDGDTDENPDQACPDSVPEGEGIGHLGGDSPWA